MESEEVVVLRECAALSVPDGTPLTIPAGTAVRIFQSLGDSHSVIWRGNMVRIDDRDADALGLQPQSMDFGEPADDSVDEANVWETLRRVYDPEIPVNIVDLGLVYGCEVRCGTDRGNVVEVRMTLTSPGCGMGEVLVDNIKFRVAKVPNVDHVKVDLIFDPPWSQDMMTEEAQLELGML